MLENLTDDAIAKLYVNKFSTISLYPTKLYVTWSFVIASSVTISEIRQIFSNSVVCSLGLCKIKGLHSTTKLLQSPIGLGKILQRKCVFKKNTLQLVDKCFLFFKVYFKICSSSRSQIRSRSWRNKSGETRSRRKGSGSAILKKQWCTVSNV